MILLDVSIFCECLGLPYEVVIVVTIIVITGL